MSQQSIVGLFQEPPIRTRYDGGDGDKDGIFDDFWQKWFQKVSRRFSSPLPNVTPATSAALGIAGQACYDANFLYVCVATNTWKRIPLNAF